MNMVQVITDHIACVAHKTRRYAQKTEIALFVKFSLYLCRTLHVKVLVNPLKHFIKKMLCTNTRPFAGKKKLPFPPLPHPHPHSLSLSVHDFLSSTSPTPLISVFPCRPHSFFIHASLLSILSRTYSYTLRLLHKMSAPPVTSVSLSLFHSLVCVLSAC